jgi:hypothetical protein
MRCLVLFIVPRSAENIAPCANDRPFVSYTRPTSSYGNLRLDCSSLTKKLGIADLRDDRPYPLALNQDSHRYSVFIYPVIKDSIDRNLLDVTG